MGLVIILVFIFTLSELIKLFAGGFFNSQFMPFIHDNLAILEVSATNSNLLSALTTIVSVVITTFIGFKLGKRKSTADAQKTELEAVQDAITIWRKTAEALDVQVKNISLEVASLRTENLELKKNVERLNAQNSYLTNVLKRFTDVEGKLANDLEELEKLTDGEVEKS